MSVNGINHITLRTQNLDRSEHFYTKILGLKKVGERSHMRFFSSGGFVHELALMLDPEYQRNEKEGLLHVCFNVASKADLQALYKKCLHQDLNPSSGVDHIVMHSFYLRDPDGHVVEIGMDRPQQEWQDKPDPFEGDYALDLFSHS